MSNKTEIKEVILILTISPWGEPKRLRRQLAEVLSANYDVIYVTLPYGYRRPKRNCEFQDGRVTVLSFSGPWVPFRLLDRLKFLRRLFEKYLSWSLSEKLKKIQIKAIFCFTSNYPTLLKRYAGFPLIYVANDDFESFLSSSTAKKNILRNEADAIKHCGCVVSVSEVIARKLAVHGKPVHIMYPGHDCIPLLLGVSNNQQRLDKSACFYGYIDWRIDFILLERMLNEGWHVALIGPKVGTAQKIRWLQKLYPRSFEVQPAVISTKVLEQLTKYSVLIIPYLYQTPDQAEFIELPNKVFIYFSALRPIVTTWMPNLKFVKPGLIYRAKTHEDFIEYCYQAMREDSMEYASNRREIANENNWDSRRDTLERLINGANFLAAS